MTQYAMLQDTVLLKTIYNKLSETGLTVYISQPEAKAVFPVITLQPPISTPRNMGAAWQISVTVEVWGNRHFDPKEKSLDTGDYFTIVKNKMLELNFTCVNQLPPLKDLLTQKIRYGGYFEARWNATTNTLERNK